MTFGGWSKVRSLRVLGLRSPKHSGGLGPPPPGITTGCEELADGGRLCLPRLWSATTVRSGTGVKEPKENEPSTKSAGPSTEKCRGGAPEGERACQQARTASLQDAGEYKLAPFGAPLPSIF